MMSAAACVPQRGEVERASPRRQAISVRADATRPIRRRILLAEDDDEQRLGLCDYLELSGYEVAAVASGSELLEALADVLSGKQARPDLIITDIHMPGVPGLNVAEEIRAEGWGEPIIVISAFGNVPNVLQRLAGLEAVRFLAKPFDPAALTDIVDDLTT